MIVFKNKVMPVPLKDLLTELKSRLMALYGVRMKGLCLYGSYAHGEQHSESDVDVLIIVDRVDRYSGRLEESRHAISRECPRRGHSRVKDTTEQLLRKADRSIEAARVLAREGDFDFAASRDKIKHWD